MWWVFPDHITNKFIQFWTDVRVSSFLDEEAFKFNIAEITWDG